MSSPSFHICHSPKSLFLCPLCSSIEYCSNFHQSDDTDRHFQKCQRIQHALNAISRTEAQILTIRLVPPPAKFDGHEINKDKEKAYKFDTTGLVVSYDEDGNPENIKPSDDIYTKLPFEIFHVINGNFDSKILEHIELHYGDEGVNIYSGNYDYGRGGGYDNNINDAYDPFKHRIHMINLYKPLDASIY
ncbi:uncharacterized protein DFL_006375 [Arthrobotrys flagrans]|uniref:MYND-type domain-containing protein n=1 Tax=Arthrobotrys flagrans TaxID=97331 RepID=A0A437A109_ARTFL|nr:hypothetical protein DFL_006375 [Arthrobotrys flagrans]